jgi:hypothetical protein
MGILSAPVLQPRRRVDNRALLLILGLARTEFDGRWLEPSLKCSHDNTEFQNREAGLDAASSGSAAFGAG